MRSRPGCDSSSIACRSCCRPRRSRARWRRSRAGSDGPTRRMSAARSARAAQLVEATLHHRRIAMRYHSMSSDREKAYLVEPYRLVFAQGGLYVVAFVPEYGQLRTFAVDRILGLSLTEERSSRRTRRRKSFAHSLGVNQGTPPQRVEISFAPRIARYVKERVWHASQQADDQPDGSVTWCCTSRTTGRSAAGCSAFGPLARVVCAPELAAQVSRLERLERRQGGCESRAYGSWLQTRRVSASRFWRALALPPSAEARRAGVASAEAEARRPASERGRVSRIALASPSRRLEIQPVRPLHQEHVRRGRVEHAADVAAEVERAVIERASRPCCQTTKRVEPGRYSQRRTLVVRNER